MESSRKSILNAFFWIVIISVSVAFYYTSVLPYVTGTLEPRKEAEKWWLITHFISAACTLFLGPLQFWPAFQNRFYGWHRTAGKCYIAGSVISACTVFIILLNYPLPGSIPSLGLLALIWIFTTLAAYWFALKKNYKQHKAFMVRSYVCGIAFVIIRLFPLVDERTGAFSFMVNEEVRFTVYEWMCWIYPFVLTELALSWIPEIKKVKHRSGKV